MVINADVKYQSILGFGGAFTDSAGINILDNLKRDAREKLLEAYYAPTGQLHIDKIITSTYCKTFNINQPLLYTPDQQYTLCLELWFSIWTDFNLLFMPCPKSDRQEKKMAPPFQSWQAWQAWQALEAQRFY